MKLIKQDIAITLNQLEELYQYRPVDFKDLLESAKCYHCGRGEISKPFMINLTKQNTIRLEGNCQNCGKEVHSYSCDTPDA